MLKYKVGNLIDTLCVDPQNFSHESILLVNSLMQLIKKSNNNITSYGEILRSHYVPCLQAISEL